MRHYKRLPISNPGTQILNGSYDSHGQGVGDLSFSSSHLLAGYPTISY